MTMLIEPYGLLKPLVKYIITPIRSFENTWIAPKEYCLNGSTISCEYYAEIFNRGSNEVKQKPPRLGKKRFV